MRGMEENTFCLEVPAEAAGKRLDGFLAGEQGLTRSAAQKLIESGCVLVEGKPAAKSLKLQAGWRGTAPAGRAGSGAGGHPPRYRL